MAKTIAELMEMLVLYPPSDEVFMSTDEEGNNFHAFEDIDDRLRGKIILFPGGKYEELM